MHLQPFSAGKVIKADILSDFYMIILNGVDRRTLGHDPKNFNALCHISDISLCTIVTTVTATASILNINDV